MFLVDGDVLGRSVNLAGGGVDDRDISTVPGSLEDIVGPLHVGFDIGEGRNIGIGDADEGREVKDHVAPFKGTLYGVVIPDVSADHREGVF